jgi:hypothetical protein
MAAYPNSTLQLIQFVVAVSLIDVYICIYYRKFIVKFIYIYHSEFIIWDMWCTKLVSNLYHMHIPYYYPEFITFCILICLQKHIQGCESIWKWMQDLRVVTRFTTDFPFYWWYHVCYFSSYFYKTYRILEPYYRPSQPSTRPYGNSKQHCKTMTQKIMAYQSIFHQTSN